MKVSLTDISQQRIRQQGFLCSTAIINKDMILLNKVEKSVILDNHNHPHAQLGYCFNGNFDFEAEGNHFDMYKGQSFLLDGEVFHSAVATTDYYPMDIKVMLKEDVLAHRMASNVFEETINTTEYLIKKASIGSYHVQSITYFKCATVDIKLDINRKHFVVVSTSCSFHVHGLLSSLNMKPMKIYQLEIDRLQFGITPDIKDVEILFITY